MSAPETFTYTCHRCGFVNRWSRDEILRAGTRVIFRGEEMERYSLPCKNPARPHCDGRHKVGIPREDPS